MSMEVIHAQSKTSWQTLEGLPSSLKKRSYIRAWLMLGLQTFYPTKKGRERHNQPHLFSIFLIAIKKDLEEQLKERRIYFGSVLQEMLSIVSPGTEKEWWLECKAADHIESSP